MKRPDIFTDHLYIGLRGSKCVAMAWKLTDARENARTVRDWVKKGLDVQTVHKSDCDRYWAEMRLTAIPREEPAREAHQ